MRRIPAVRASLPVATLVLLLAAAAVPALGQDVHSIEPLWDSVVGNVEPGAPPRLLPIRLLEGSRVSVEVKAAKGVTLHPKVTLLGPDRKEDPDAAGKMIVASKGAKVVMKDYVPKETALHWLKIEGEEGTSGGWTMKSKVKLAKGMNAVGPNEPGAEVDLPFVAPGRATASVKVTASPKGAGPPSFKEIKDPSGSLADPGVVKPTKTGFSLAGADLPLSGTHVLSFLPGPGGDGTWKVKMKWKVGKGVKRILGETRVIADPVVTSISPTSGDVTQTADVRIAVDFAQPGAIARFQSGTSVVTVAAGSITHSPGEVRFLLNLAPFGNGIYAVTVVNPDGGAGTLPAAFTVQAVSPEPVSVSPNSAYEGEVVRLRITGTRFFGNVAVRLRQGSLGIPGVLVGTGPGYVDADFDLTGAAIGLWDLGMTNPGAPEAFLVGALDVLHVVTLDSMTPEDNSAGLVVDAVILGNGFLPGATATLTRDGGAVTIPGTGVQVVSMAEIRAVFDTTGQEAAFFDLVVTSPGGAVRTLADAFRTRPQKGDPSEPVQPITASFPADGPPALALDPTRAEYLVAWVEEDNSGKQPAWTLYAQKLDKEGTALDSPVAVSSDDGTSEKRYPTAGYDPVNDEYLVCWSEQRLVTPTQTMATHPNGTNSLLLYEVLVQRLSAGDLSTLESSLIVSDRTTYNGTSKGVTWTISDFNNLRPSIAFDEGAEQWEIAWMHEFDTSGLYFNDNYDVLRRSFEPTKMVLGNLVRPAATDNQEGDPCLAWDGKGQRVILAHAARSSTKGTELDLYLDGSQVVAGSGDDLGDPRMAIDGNTGTLVLAWTRVASDGTRAAEAATVSLDDLSSVVGDVLVLGKGGTDMLVRPVANQEFEEIHLFWTRFDDSDQAFAMRRSASASGDAGLEALGDEAELSSGSGDGGLPTAVYSGATGDTAVVWFETLTVTGNSTYIGDVLPKGTIRGTAFWFQLFR